MWIHQKMQWVIKGKICECLKIQIHPNLSRYNSYNLKVFYNSVIHTCTSIIANYLLYYHDYYPWIMLKHFWAICLYIFSSKSHASGLLLYTWDFNQSYRSTMQTWLSNSIVDNWNLNQNHFADLFTSANWTYLASHSTNNEVNRKLYSWHLKVPYPFLHMFDYLSPQMKW